MRSRSDAHRALRPLARHPLYGDIGTLVLVRLSTDSMRAICSELDALHESDGDYGHTVVETDLEYRPGHPVRIDVRKRVGRYDLTDDAAAVNLAGRPRDWLPTVSDTVAGMGMNVNRRGVVYVTGFAWRDVADLAMRLAECSRRVYVSLLDTSD
jgi:hypothetical protein